MADTAMEQHTTHAARAALRCAYGDAAALCDLIEKDVVKSNTGRRGLTQAGSAIAYAVKQAADRIWTVREMIVMPEDEP
jgi:hypothetical protein